MRLKCCWPDGEQVNEGVNELNLIAVKLQGEDKKSKRKITTDKTRQDNVLFGVLYNSKYIDFTQII